MLVGGRGSLFAVGCSLPFVVAVNCLLFCVVLFVVTSWLLSDICCVLVLVV